MALSKSDTLNYESSCEYFILSCFIVAPLTFIDLIIQSYHSWKTRVRSPTAFLDKHRHNIQRTMLKILSKFKISLINSVHKHSWKDHFNS